MLTIGLHMPYDTMVLLRLLGKALGMNQSCTSCTFPCCSALEPNGFVPSAAQCRFDSDEVPIKTIELTTAQNGAVNELLDAIYLERPLRFEANLLEEARFLAQRLPLDLQREFYKFQRHDAWLAVKITNNPIDPTQIGPTPQSFVETDPLYELNKAQILNALYAALLGESFGFSSQRAGKCFNNIIPLREKADIANFSSGSTFKFDFHTEDAFHPVMGDYLGLVCMRNEEQAITSITSVRLVQLTASEHEVLSRPIFKIRANPIHSLDDSIEYARVPILFGAPANPFMRINLATLDMIEQPPDVREVLVSFIRRLHHAAIGIVLGAGDCLYIDNFYSAHARDPYEPNYGPNARWLSRLVISRDLRRSAAFRNSVASRTICS